MSVNELQYPLTGPIPDQHAVALLLPLLQLLLLLPLLQLLLLLPLRDRKSVV